MTQLGSLTIVKIDALPTSLLSNLPIGFSLKDVYFFICIRMPKKIPPATIRLIKTGKENV